MSLLCGFSEKPIASMSNMHRIMLLQAGIVDILAGWSLVLANFEKTLRNTVGVSQDKFSVWLKSKQI